LTSEIAGKTYFERAAAAQCRARASSNQYFRTQVVAISTFRNYELETCQNIGDLVGAVGIENNNVRNFKGLRGIRGNAKSLRRNNKARKGVLIAPSKLPRFSRRCDSNGVGFSLAAPKSRVDFGPNLAARMASRRFI
jgi:hypothetical protein